jgi:hypothetical protein
MLMLGKFDLGPALGQLETTASDVSEDEDRKLDRLLPAAAEEARAAAAHWQFLAPAQVIDAMIANREVFPRAGEGAGKTRLRRVVVARLALNHFEIPDALPESVMALYPDHFRRLVKFLSEGTAESYDEEYFAKDVRYALGVTAPGGALQFDFKYWISPKLIVRHCLKSRASHSLLAYLAAAGWGRWYNEHIDLRAMRDFNPEGWTRHCARVAEVLELNPSVRGIVGVGWFYDPAVSENSPGLAYIRKTQMKYGGFLVRVGTEPHHIQNAIYRSAVRRRLYEEGKYLPTCYLMAWPRGPLLAWAEELKRDPSVGFAASDETASARPVIGPKVQSDSPARAVAP